MLNTPMLKQTLTAAALTVVLAAPAFAQQQPSANPPATKMDEMKSDQMRNSQSSAGSMNAADRKVGFIQSQDSRDWRGSKLIGATIYGPDNNSIGEINDVLIGDNAEVKAVVVGVGGFLGVGEKDVALPFSALNITRKQGAAAIDKVTVSYTKDELKNAPRFAYFDDSSKSQTTGAATDSSKPMATDGKMNDSRMKK